MPRHLLPLALGLLLLACAPPCPPGGCPCLRDADCGDGQSCAVERAAAPAATCRPARGGAPAYAPCAGDADCDRGSCLFGACQPLCQVAADCPGGAAAASCTATPMLLEGTASGVGPRILSCLPRDGALRAALPASGALVVPETARGVALLLAAPGYDLMTTVGLERVEDPAGRALYRRGADDETFYGNVLRHRPGRGSATLLLTASPGRAPLLPGVYRYRAYGEDQDGAAVPVAVSAFYQLSDAPLPRGRVPLRVHLPPLTTLPAGCKYRELRAANAAELLGPALVRLREIFAQPSAALRLEPITFSDEVVANLVDLDNPTALGALLRVATEQGEGGLDLLLLRALLPAGVSGAPGGTPATPGVPATPQTGAVLSVEALCEAGSGVTDRDLGQRMARELARSLGLFLSRDALGRPDPLGDGEGPSESAQDPDNLLQLVPAATHVRLTAEQGLVLRSMPQVRSDP